MEKGKGPMPPLVRLIVATFGLLLVNPEANASGDDPALVQVVDLATGMILNTYRVPPTEVIVLEAGQKVLFTNVAYGDPFDPEVLIEEFYDRHGGYVLVTTNKGVVRIENFIDLLERGREAALAFADSGQTYDGVPVPNFDSLEDFMVTALGPVGAAAAGSEIYGFIAVLGWWLDRLEIPFGPAAAQPEEMVSTEQAPLLKQLLAQLAIARTREILSLAEKYQASASDVRADITFRVEQGRGNMADLLQARPADEMGHAIQGDQVAG